MTPVAPTPAERVPSSAAAPPPGRARSAAAGSRRRRALLELARRHGEVRLQVASPAGVTRGAAEVSELLDMLNEDGLLRYGGLHAGPGGPELVYLAA